MKNASRTMFNVGNIFNVIQLILGALFFVIGVICAIIGAASDHPEVASTGGSLIGWGIYFLVVAILCFVFVGKAKRQLQNDDSRNPSPYILTIVFGAIACNPFYVLAGIFGLIANGQNNNGGNNDEPRSLPREEPREEPRQEQKIEKSVKSDSPFGQ